MKKLLTIAVLSGGIILACQKEDSKDPISSAQKNTLSPEEEQVSKSTGKVVAFSEVKPLIEAFQKENPNEIRAVAYGKEALENVLSQKGCVGVRFYFAKENGNNTLVFVGVDKNMNDIKSSANARTNDGGDAGANGMPCPQFCNGN